MVKLAAVEELMMKNERSILCFGLNTVFIYFSLWSVSYQIEGVMHKHSTLSVADFVFFSSSFDPLRLCEAYLCLQLSKVRSHSQTFPDGQDDRLQDSNFLLKLTWRLIKSVTTRTLLFLASVWKLHWWNKK